MKFIEISSEEQREILGYVQENTGLKSAIIEKDWWVTAVLRAIFMLPYSKHISFKGGLKTDDLVNTVIPAMGHEPRIVSLG